VKSPTPIDACLFEGAIVKHAHRHTGFGVSKETGIIQSFIEPEPGWHRALVAWTDEDGNTTEQFVDTDKLIVDAIGTLAKLVAEAGLTMTPRVTNTLVEKSIMRYLDVDKYEAVIAEEDCQRAQLQRAVAKIQGRKR